MSTPQRRKRENTSLIISTSKELEHSYDDTLHHAGIAADKAYRPHIFSDYQLRKSEATRQAQFNDLTLFSRFLTSCGIHRSAEALYSDPQSWNGMNYALLEGFRAWLYYKQPDQEDGKQHGFTISSVKRRLSTVRTYSQLAYKSGVLSMEEYQRIQLVQGDAYGDGINIDQHRREMNITPHIVERKNAKTVVRRTQASQLKKTTSRHESSRVHDQLLQERDELLMCLLIEHGLRVSEIVNLNDTSINLEEKTIVVKRSKNYSEGTLRLMPGTYTAATHYLPLLNDYKTILFPSDDNELLASPLFYGYEGQRITRFGIYDRVRELGTQVGIKNLSPHILRNYWVQDAFRQKSNSLDMIQQYGGWKSAIMPLYYAQQHRPLTEDFKISE